MSILLKAWPGPFQGLPPWADVVPSEFVEAFQTALTAAKQEMNLIANASSEPTFQNTLVQLELSGEQLNRLEALFAVHCHNLNVGVVSDAERVVKPLLAEYADTIIQNQPLFTRIRSVYNTKDTLTLTNEEQRLLKHRFDEFVRNGANLGTSDKSRLMAINQRLATLFTEFGQNILEEEKEITWIENAENLKGIPANQIESLAASAKENGREGIWAVLNTRSCVEPFLEYAAERSLREIVWKKFYTRCENPNKYNNYEIIKEILTLRAERAKMLGYKTHAHWRVESEMATTPEQAMELLLQVWPKAVNKVKEEVADMQLIANDDKITIEPWDYRFYAEKVRKAKYDLDFNEVTPYLDCEKIREGMFWVANQLHGLEFVLLPDVSVFHPDVRAWEVKREGKHVGVWYFDPYCRPGKNSGAWMSEYRAQQKLKGSTPIVSNNSNFVKGSPGKPVLISWDDAITMFHEFGHALHGLLSNVTYPTLAGTNVARDFVEFPSQLNEHWLETKEFLNKFAVHHETGAPLPGELVDKIKKASKFNEGFRTVEYLACALIDMKVHLLDNPTIDPLQFEKATLSELGMPKEIVMRHRTPHFAHIFSSDSYSAGYYSYLWADTLVADAAEAFEESPGGYYDNTVAKKYYDCVLSVGNSVDPKISFRNFRGRDVDTKALLKKRGFPTD